MLSGPERAGRRAGVLGSPIAHSLSPVLHRAAYDALGLGGWAYDAVRVETADFPTHVGALGPEWVGLSLTMPLKEVALELAASASELAVATGAANTLVRLPPGESSGESSGQPASQVSWRADNTDVHGVVQALAEVGVAEIDHVLLVGSGATARSVLAAASRLGARAVTFVVRDAVRPVTLRQAEQAGLVVDVRPLGTWPTDVDVVVSTVPPDSTAGWAHGLPAGGHALLDVVYGDGPTPLTRAAETRGWPVVSGTAMLLHQAARQVELMTGLDAPVEAMRSALTAAMAGRGVPA